MTSQVITMNRLGVGIASDSMTTLTGVNGERKRFTDARKIFEISSDHKVIVLAYGNMDLNGAPIWSLLAQWGRTIPNPLDTVHDYATSFLEFVRYHPSLDAESETEIIKRVRRKLGTIGAEIDSYADANTDLSPSEIESAALSWLKSTRDQVKLWPATTDFTLLSQTDFNSIRATIKKYLAEVFIEDYYSPKLLKTLAELGFEMMTKSDPNLHNESGLVFVGYGLEDFDPALTELSIECFYHYCMQGVITKVPHTPSRTNPGWIHPYAQASAINAFLNGQSFDAEVRMGALIDTAFEEHSALLNASQNQDLQPLGVFKEAVTETVRERLSDFSVSTYERFSNAVRAMDVSAMAEFAESLVNLEAMSGLALDADATVGGFVQVLTIDPHEGIRWRKRLDPNR